MLYRLPVSNLGHVYEHFNLRTYPESPVNTVEYLKEVHQLQRWGRADGCQVRIPLWTLRFEDATESPFRHKIF